MGLSVSAATAIIFIAVVLVFGALLGAWDKGQDYLLDSQREIESRHADLLNTRVSIANVDQGQNTITIINDGSVTLDVTDVDLLIDGVLSNDKISDWTVGGVSNTFIWMPTEELVLTLSFDIKGEDIAVITGNGVVAYA